MATQFNKFENRKNLKLGLIEGAELIGKYNFPRLKRSDYIPKNIVPFNYLKTIKEPEKYCVHFFIDDYQFERIWNYPERYLKLLKKFEGVITPDFSMYNIMPVAQRIWNCYRNRVLAYWMQENEIKIVPNVGWTYYNELSWCLDGIIKNSNIAIGSYGSLKDKKKTYGLLKGLERISKEVSPNNVICYGPEIKSAYGLCNNIIFFDNYCKTMKMRI